MNSKDRSSSKSLCERSMKMVTNIIKLSSFSIVKASLGTTTTSRSESTRSLSLSVEGDGSYMVAPEPPSLLTAQAPGSRRSQEISKPIKYLVEPGQEAGSTCLVHGEKNIDGMASDYINRVHKKNIDGMASDYINRVHKKNRPYIREVSKEMGIILPPPTRVVK